MCGQVLAPRSTRRAGCPGGDIVPLRRGVGLRHRLVSLSDIMCDWPSARPPARPLPEPTRRGCLGTSACSGDPPPAALRASGEHSAAQGVSTSEPGWAPPHRPALEGSKAGPVLCS